MNHASALGPPSPLMQALLAALSAGPARPVRAQPRPCQQCGRRLAPRGSACEYCAANSPPPSELQRTVGGPRVGRNDPCPCGSGKKWKHCHRRA